MKISCVQERRAVIDVGTNSVKLLVAEVGCTAKPVLKLSRQTRLGEGAFRSRRLQQDAIARTAAAVAEFAAQAAQVRSISIRVVATCATRETSNGGELVDAIQSVAGLRVQVISGDQEARLVFRGVSSDQALAGQPLLVVDVGGGSTEWVVGHDDQVYFTATTPLGTARLLELTSPSDPPLPDELAHCRRRVVEVLRREVHPKLQPLLSLFVGRAPRLVGLGGALKSLVRLGTAPGSSSEDGEPACIGLDQLRDRIECRWRLTSRQRRELEGLDPEKADVVLTGAVIHEAVMAEFGFSELFVSQHGLREGVLLADRDIETRLPHPNPSRPSRPDQLQNWPGALSGMLNGCSRRASLVPR